MAMCKENLNNLSRKLTKKLPVIFNGFNEFVLTLAPSMLIIVTIWLTYFFRNALAGDMNSISIIVTLFSFSFAVLLAVNQYSLKAKAEKVEHEVRLLTIFSEIMEIAHARGEAFVVNNEIKNAPIGVAAQDAAIAAINTLGDKYNDILGVAANQGLESLIFKSNVVGKYRNNEEIYKKISEDFDRNLSIKQKYREIWIKKGKELYDQGKYLDSVEAYSMAKLLYSPQISADVEDGLKKAIMHSMANLETKDS
ncbi:MAG: hypothetical protein WBN94_06345 [Methanothrix sp.]